MYEFLRTSRYRLPYFRINRYAVSSHAFLFPRTRILIWPASWNSIRNYETRPEFRTGGDARIRRAFALFPHGPRKLWFRLSELWSRTVRPARFGHFLNRRWCVRSPLSYFPPHIFLQFSSLLNRSYIIRPTYPTVYPVGREGVVWVREGLSEEKSSSKKILEKM